MSSPGAPSSVQPQELLRIEDVCVSFQATPRVAPTHAAQGVRWSLHAGKSLAVVGESGSGKSVTAMAALGLLPSPPASVGPGRAVYTTAAGEKIDLLSCSSKRLRSVRGGGIAMVFQEPMTSLNPVFTVGEQVAEAVRLHTDLRGAAARGRAIDAMSEVGIPDPARRFRAYPHEFSGGMRQRVMIAMALACGPRVLLADEATTALDVTVQEQVLDLLDAARSSRGLALLLITHDLGLVAQRADAVCVMCAGRVVEYASADVIFDRPLHPYTRALLASAPTLAARKRRLVTVADAVADAAGFLLPPAFGAGLHAWWPSHPPPPNLVPHPVQSHAAAPSDYTLAEVAPCRWVGLWRTGKASQLPDRFPSLAGQRRAAALERAPRGL